MLTKAFGSSASCTTISDTSTWSRKPCNPRLNLGATPSGTFFQITLPLIRPGVLVGALFAFITSFDELVVALFISGSGAVTLPRRMWDDLLFQIEPTIAAVSTLTIVLTAALMGCAHVLRKRAPT
jgi:putative spermidine/putrescine transport system permease protein